MTIYKVTEDGNKVRLLYRCSYCKRPLMPFLDMVNILYKKYYKEEYKIPNYFYSLCRCSPSNAGSGSCGKNNKRPSLDWYDNNYDEYNIFYNDNTEVV